MSKLFRPSHRALQERYDAVRLADRIESHLFREHVTADDKAFIERLDMFFLASPQALIPSCGPWRYDAADCAAQCRRTRGNERGRADDIGG
jgi:hypothetical protein